MSDRRVVLTGARIYDGLGSEPASGDVVIAGGRIVDITTRADGDEVVELDGASLLPGLIDLHVHVMVETFSFTHLTETPFSLAFYVAAQNLDATLHAGITTARDCGGADLGVKQAVDLGFIPGPQLDISVNLLSITGGHADYWGAAGYPLPDFVPHPGRPDGVCDGREGVLQRAREMVRSGADFIKVCATGGLLSPRDRPDQTQFIPEELEAAVAVANAAGIYVAAHAQGPEGIKSAIRAGVRTIEHGFLLDDEGIELMLQRGVFFVPTLMAPRAVVELAGHRAQSEIDLARSVIDKHDDAVRRAIAAGVDIAMGTDAGAFRHGRNLEELAHLVRLGMSPRQAIRAATSIAARAIDKGDDRGSIEVGKSADLAAFWVNPETDISALADSARVAGVWQRGERVVAGNESTVDHQVQRESVKLEEAAL